MFALLGTVFGFFSSTFPSLIGLWKDHQDKKQELAIMNLQMEAQKVLHTQHIEEINVEADIKESEALYKSSEIKLTGVGFIDGFVSLYNSSVRPTVTYVFFAMYCFIKIKTILILLPILSNATFMQNITLIWTEEDMAIFCTIIGYWFGQRGLQKFMAKK